MSNEKTYPHYFRRIPTGVTHVDIYAILRLFEVEDGAIAHALKKLLCAGKRGAKDRTKDLQEARDSITRALELDEAFAENPSDIIKTLYDNCTAFDFGPSVSKEQAQAVIRKILSCNSYSPSNRLIITNAPPGTLSGPGLSPDQLLLIVEPVPTETPKSPGRVRADELRVGDRIVPNKYNEGAAKIVEITLCASGKITTHYAYESTPDTITYWDWEPQERILLAEPVPVLSAPTTDYGCCSVLPATEAERIVWVLNNEGPFTKDKPLKVHRAPPGTAMKIEFKYLPLIEWV